MFSIHCHDAKEIELCSHFKVGVVGFVAILSKATM
jgi:hypothetical protein